MLFHGREWNFSICFFFINTELPAEIPSKQRTMMYIINKGNHSLGGLQTHLRNHQWIIWERNSTHSQVWGVFSSGLQVHWPLTLRKWWQWVRLQCLSSVSGLWTLLKSSPGRNYFHPTIFLLEREAEEQLLPLVLHCPGCLQLFLSHNVTPLCWCAEQVFTPVTATSTDGLSLGQSWVQLILAPSDTR